MEIKHSKKSLKFKIQNKRLNNYTTFCIVLLIIAFILFGIFTYFVINQIEYNNNKFIFNEKSSINNFIKAILPIVFNGAILLTHKFFTINMVFKDPYFTNIYRKQEKGFEIIINALFYSITILYIVLKTVPINLIIFISLILEFIIIIVVIYKVISFIIRFLKKLILNEPTYNDKLLFKYVLFFIVCILSIITYLIFF